MWTLDPFFINITDNTSLMVTNIMRDIVYDDMGVYVADPRGEGNSRNNSWLQLNHLFI